MRSTSMDKGLGLMLGAVLTLAALGASTAAHADWIGGRQDAQRERIRDGVHGGTLTRREARRLRRDQRRIARMDERFASDGVYSRRERRRIHRALDRASDRIWRAEHNGRDRRGGAGHRARHRHAGHGHRERVTEIHHHYETAPAEPEVVETLPTISRSVELDLNGVRVIWSSTGIF